MTAKLADRVKETSTSTGSGTINLDGAVSGFQTFVAGIGSGNSCYYCITGGAEWEVGIGTVTDATPDTLSRTTILASSNAGSAVTLSAGTKDVFCTAPASRIQSGSVLYDSGALSVAASTIDTGANGIAGGYSVLEVYFLLRTDEAVQFSEGDITLNNDTGSNYDRLTLQGFNATTSSAVQSGNAALLFNVAGASATASYFTAGKLTIPFYAETTAFKTITAAYGSDGVSNLIFDNEAYTWKSTAAVTRMAFAVKTSGKKWIAGSHVLILGIG